MLKSKLVSNLLEDKVHLMIVSSFLALGLIIALIKLLLFTTTGVIFALFGFIPFIIFTILCLFIKKRWVVVTSGLFVFTVSISILVYVLYGLFIIQGSAAPLMLVITPLPETIATIIFCLGLCFADYLLSKYKTTKQNNN